MEIFSVNDEKFRKYGKVWNNIECTKLIKGMEHTPLPEAKTFSERVFGGLPIQIGYCNGNNHKLNAVEYHRNSEINIAVTDMILLLGWLPDVTDEFTYDTAKIEAFKVPAGTVVEMYETTLHYAPCNAADGGFKCVVILP